MAAINPSGSNCVKYSQHMWMRYSPAACIKHRMHFIVHIYDMWGKIGKNWPGDGNGNAKNGSNKNNDTNNSNNTTTTTIALLRGRSVIS